MPQSRKDIWINSTYKHKRILKKIPVEKVICRIPRLIAFTQSMKNL